jgi:hypothetical protein
MATEIDAKGDLVVGTGADTFSRLAVASTAGYLLSVDSGETTGLKWAAPAAAGFVGCSLYQSANISVGNDASPILTWDTERFDTDGFHSTVSNTSRITIPTGKGGKYLVIMLGAYAANSTGYRLFAIYKNGGSGQANQIVLAQIANLSSTIGPFFGGTAIMNLVATDYIEISTNQTSSGNLNFLGREDYNMFAVQYLGA